MTRGDSNNRGYVYILVNPAFPGFLKIGKTTKDPEARARELSSGSGVPAPYAVAWDAFVNDCAQVERLIHQQLAHDRSRNDREFFAIPLKNAVSIVASIAGPFSCEPDGPRTEVSVPVGAVSSLPEPKVTVTADASTEVLTVPAPRVGEYSDTDYLHRAVRNFCEIVLPRKKEREAEAEEVLRRFRGKYTVEVLEKVFDLVDKGPIGPITGPWFGEMLSTHNRHNVYALCRRPRADLNILIDKLRETGDLGVLGEWRRADKRNRGVATGVATLLMYLHSPDRYNVWLPKNHSGLSRLCHLGAEFPKGEISPEEYRILYKAFNDNAIAVREENGLDPQAVDWFLFAVDEINVNPGNRSLQAMSEGRTK